MLWPSGVVAVAETKRGRPTENRAANKSIADDTSSIADLGASWDEIAEHVDGAFVVLVRTASGRYRRRVWLTLAPAERAAQKAIDAGHSATVVLAELKPLYRITGGGADE